MAGNSASVSTIKRFISITTQKKTLLLNRPVRPDRTRCDTWLSADLSAPENPAVNRTYLQLGSKASAIQSRLAMEVSV